MTLRLYLLWVFLLGSIPGFSQIQSPQTPQSGGFQPLYGNTPNNSPYTPTYQQPGKPVHMGATAQDVFNGVSNANARQYATAAQRREEYEAVMRELRVLPRNNNTNYRRDSASNAIATQGFFPALRHLQDMLEGKVPFSLADAYYTTENAYGSNYLTRKQYDNIIKQSVDFIKTWMQQNNLSTKDNYQVQLAIQKFLSETLTITKTKTRKEGMKKITTVTHKPFYYDFDDYEYKKDYRNSFLTKCFATGFGQCSSMPAVYLVLAEALGVKAYLTITPYHSFVKYLDNDGNIVNYEPTSNWEISDKWYKDNMFISAQAVASGIYLDTFNYRQVVANCIFDLANEYMRVDRSLNEDFVNASIKAGVPYFPRNNNLESLLIYSSHLKTELREVMQRNGITDMDEIRRVPEAYKLYREYMGNEGYIKKLGYQDMPTGLYETMMQQQEFKGHVQKNLAINGKQKRNLFEITN